MAVVDDDEVVVVSFFFKPSSLLSFVLHFVAFLLSSCDGSGDEVAVVVVEANVVALVGIAFFSASLVVASSCFFGTGTGLFSATAAASLNCLHSLRCPPSFQWFT